MRVLLLHPDDALDGGPWSGMQWDLVVDLGWAGRCSYASMATRLACPVISLQELDDPLGHAAKLREQLALGLGCMVDRYGIDWWEFANPYRVPVLDQILHAARLSEQIPRDAELVATRPHFVARILSELRGSEHKTIQDVPAGRFSFERYARLLRAFTPQALAQIAFDKWDADYSVRRWFVRAAKSTATGVVLLPSAYRNVTRSQADYARMLPQHKFLSVVTRRDGLAAGAPPNMRSRSLAAYRAKRSNPATEREISELQLKWRDFEAVKSSRELQIADRLGAFRTFPQFLATGLRVRDAWDVVLQRENICSLLSADENNPFTRLPVWLACERGIPTVYAEHGALNFNLGLRIPCSDRYLARGEMMKDYWVRYCHLPEDKIELGAPENVSIQAGVTDQTRDLITFFSSNYEASRGRVADFYRDVLPPLCELAQKNGRRVVVKLHPFESLPERRRCIEAILTREQRGYLEVRGGTLDSALLLRTWVALTVESSAAVECALAGVPSFLCSWFDSAWWGYGEQFVRFRVAQPLASPEEIQDIPNRLLRTPAKEDDLSIPISRERLEAILGLRASTAKRACQNASC